MASNAIKTRTAAAIATGAAVKFTPRNAFPLPKDIPRSYYLGHHKAGLERMRGMLSQIDLVIECRDYRIPYTSRNQLLEESLRERERVIVYTKWDLGVERLREARQRDKVLKDVHKPSAVHFSSTSTSSSRRSSSSARGGSAPHGHGAASVRPILEHLKEFARAHFSLTGHRVLIAGMPNVGKSTLLNSLRAAGVRKGKAARTGAQPGITRAIASSVKILDGAAIDGDAVAPATATAAAAAGGAAGDEAPSGQTAASEGVYIVDTPGVFIPYVPDAESMLKLALCGCVKDGLLPPVMLADYLLFRMNLHNPAVYGEYAGPTNEVIELLTGVARRTGRLTKGVEPDLESAAVWIVQRWRKGLLGRFVLDDVEALAQSGAADEARVAVSISQARKMYKTARIERAKEQRAARGI